MRSKIQFRTHFRTNSHVFLLILVIPITFSCKTNPENRPSPLVLEKGEVDGVTIELSYSSPAVRGRKIFGIGADYLEQFGELWRTGANKASSIYLTKDLRFDTSRIDSGKYSIFTIPNKDTWTIIFNKKWDQWGSYNYQDSLDELRMKVPVSRLPNKQERMRIFIENDSLKFSWNYVYWGIPISSFP